MALGRRVGADGSVRYAFVSPRAGWFVVLVPALALRASVVLAVVAFVVMAAVIGVLLSIGSSIGPSGAQTRRMGSTRQVAWREVAEVGTQHHWNLGTRIALRLTNGEEVVLPAPTSMTGGVAEALSQAQAYWADSRPSPS